MMRSRMTLQEIYQYLIQKNFNLSSDRILKEPLANPDIIWNIIVFLTINLRDTKFDQIQPTLSYLLDGQNHKNSLKRLKQYTIVGNIFKKIYNHYGQYPIKQILKPQKQFVFEKISALICANKFWQKITKQYQPLRTEIKLKRLQTQQLRRKLQIRTQQIQEMKRIKQKQKPIYEEKLQSIQNLSKDLSYKKKQKLDLLNSQQLLESQLKKKVKFGNQLGYNIDDLNIKIKQLERQVIHNAPKLKKQRFGLIQKYEELIKSNKEQFDIWTTKIKCFNDKLKMCQFIKEKSKTFKIEKKFKQIQSLSNQLNIVLNKLNQNNETKKQYMNTKKRLLKSIQQMEKNKRELRQSIGQEQKQLVLLRKSLGLLKDQQRVNQKNVKIVRQKNTLSKNQYSSLQDKIKYRRDKFKQKVFQFNFRLKNMQIQSKDIIKETFSEFN